MFSTGYEQSRLPWDFDVSRFYWAFWEASPEIGITHQEQTFTIPKGPFLMSQVTKGPTIESEAGAVQKCPEYVEILID